jgi:hypothetical protein
MLEYRYIDNGWVYCAFDATQAERVKRCFLLLDMASHGGLNADLYASIADTCGLRTDMKSLFESPPQTKKHMICRLSSLPSGQRNAKLLNWPRLAKVMQLAIEVYERELTYMQHVNKRYGMHMHADYATSLFYDHFCDILNQYGFVYDYVKQ